VPQGFPTSTTIANLVTYKLDFDQINICSKVGIQRTRWVDDIVFSGRIKDLEKITYKIISSVKSNGFVINEKKKKFQRRKDGNIKVVGLDVNKHRPSVPQNVIDSIKDLLFAVKELGKKEAFDLFEELFRFKNKDMQKSIEGKISFINQYNPTQAVSLKEIYDNIDWLNA
jgi:hypothetical protein